MTSIDRGITPFLYFNFKLRNICHAPNVWNLSSYAVQIQLGKKLLTLTDSRITQRHILRSRSLNKRKGKIVLQLFPTGLAIHIRHHWQQSVMKLNFRGHVHGPINKPQGKCITIPNNGFSPEIKLLLFNCTLMQLSLTFCQTWIKIRKHVDSKITQIHKDNSISLLFWGGGCGRSSPGTYGRCIKNLKPLTKIFWKYRVGWTQTTNTNFTNTNFRINGGVHCLYQGIKTF